MRWTVKARFMKICDQLPLGAELYKQLQKSFGNLNRDPIPRLASQIRMANWIAQNGMFIEGKSVFEVGTGHKPILPVGFFLCGAHDVITIDLHKRLDYNLLRTSLEWMSANRALIEGMYSEIVESRILNRQLDILEKYQHVPRQFLKEANILYVAPGDAANTNIPNQTIDFHVSNTVLEHISQDVLKSIFIEAKRILKRDGAAIHFIDLSDHFEHQDYSIEKIHFMKFTEEKWMDIAGNQFAYCNRLRASDYHNLFEELSLSVIKTESHVDSESIKSIENGFELAHPFNHKDIRDICSTSLDVMVKVKR